TTFFPSPLYPASFTCPYAPCPISSRMTKSAMVFFSFSRGASAALGVTAAGLAGEGGSCCCCCCCCCCWALAAVPAILAAADRAASLSCLVIADAVDLVDCGGGRASSFRCLGGDSSPSSSLLCSSESDGISCGVCAGVWPGDG